MSPAELLALPKVELHCHLEGSVPASLALELARRNGLPAPGTDRGLYEFETLEEFLEDYVAVSGVLRTPDDFTEVAYASLAAGARDGLVYREVAFNPTNHPGVDVADAVEAIGEGIASARAEFGVDARILVAVNREHGADVALGLVRRVVELADPLVVGIGLDHNELVGPPEEFAEAFALAGSAGLGRTAHAGERGDADEVRRTLDVLGVTRIDHGYAVLRDPGLLRRSLDEGVHYATCWSTSQWHAGPAGSPIPPMLAAGLDVSVSSDDPPMLGTGIGAEFLAAGEACGWTLADARAVVLAAAHASFLPGTEKAALLERLTREA
ncbi:adenosine deaminase [Kineococcus sp. SYSU DK003]|uniref:adenosine deaminase n=1 Tax=Kineococcus sp. SYSU DK003 TaxID=3383124 RepID=UPI003D7ECDE1